MTNKRRPYLLLKVYNSNMP